MPPPLRRRQPHTTLPVATVVQVREQAKLLLSDHRRPLAWMLAAQRARRPGRAGRARSCSATWCSR